MDDEGAIYKPRPAVPWKLDPFKGIIQARLQAFTRLTSQRLFEEIRADGYAGCYTQVKKYVRNHPADFDRRCGAAIRDAGGLPGTSGFRGIQPALGSPLCAGGRTRRRFLAVLTALTALGRFVGAVLGAHAPHDDEAGESERATAVYAKTVGEQAPPVNVGTGTIVEGPDIISAWG